jgi:hypothetical protein
MTQLYNNLKMDAKVITNPTVAHVNEFKQNATTYLQTTNLITLAEDAKKLAVKVNSLLTRVSNKLNKYLNKQGKDSQ